MTSRSKQSKTNQLLGSATGWIVGFFTIAFFLGGATLLRFSGRTDPNSFVGHHRQIVGWVSLTIGTAVLILTMNRWARVLSGLLAAATFNGLISLVQGHAINLPLKSIPRVDALLATLLFFGSTVLSALMFKGRGLSFIDRLTLLAVVSSLAWGVLGDSVTFAAVSTFVCLLFAWVYNRVWRRPHDSVSESEAKVARLY